MTRAPEDITPPKKPTRPLARARRTCMAPELMHLIPQRRRRARAGWCRHTPIHTLNEAGQMVQLPGEYWVNAVDHVDTGDDYVFLYKCHAVAVQMMKRKGRAVIYGYGGGPFLFECSLEEADEMAIGHICARLAKPKPAANPGLSATRQAQLRKWLDDVEDQG